MTVIVAFCRRGLLGSRFGRSASVAPPAGFRENRPCERRFFGSGDRRQFADCTNTIGHSYAIQLLMNALDKENEFTKAFTSQAARRASIPSADP